MNPYYQYYPFQNQINQNQQIQQMQSNVYRQEILRVNGENGARAYQIAPNSSVLLLDEQNPIVYLKTSDSGGYATITAYSITPLKNQQSIDVNSLEERITRLEKIYESNFTGNERNESSKSNDADNKSD